MIPLGDTPRDRLLAAAHDEPSAPYAVVCEGREICLRPFSLTVFRRALTIGIEAIRSGFEAVAADDLALVSDCEALAWLLTAPESDVARAMRTSRWKVAIAEFSGTCSLALLSLIRAETERHMRLIRAAMFGVVKRPPLSEAMEKAESDEKAAEPSDLLSPPRLASLALTVHRETGWPEAFVQDRLPLCRLLQYAHGIQWTNPLVWTVDPAGASLAGADPLAGLEDEPAARTAVAIEF